MSSSSYDPIPSEFLTTQEGGRRLVDVVLSNEYPLEAYRFDSDNTLIVSNIAIPFIDALILYLRKKLTKSDLSGLHMHNYSTESSAAPSTFLGTLIIGNLRIHFDDRSAALRDIIYTTSLHVPNIENHNQTSNITSDVSVFLNKYISNISSINMNDIESLQRGDTPDLYQSNFHQCLVHRLIDSPLTIVNEAGLELDLFRNLFQALIKLIKTNYQKLNGDFDKSNILHEYYEIVRRIDGSRVELRGPLDQSFNDTAISTETTIAMQQSLKCMGLRTIIDILSSITLFTGSSGDDVYPLMINTIVEVKQRIIGQEMLQQFLQSPTDYTKPFAKVFNKLVAQCVRSLCNKAIIVDSEDILFIQFGDFDAETGIIGSELFGPYKLYETPLITFMVLAFMCTNLKLSEQIEIKKKMQMEMGQIKKIDASKESQKARPRSADVPSTASESTSGESHSYETTNYELDTKHQQHHEYSTISSAYSTSTSIFPSSAPDGDTAGTSSLSSAPPSALKKYSTRLHFNSKDASGNSVIEELFDAYEFKFNNIKKQLLRANEICSIFRIHPSILKMFKNTALLSPKYQNQLSHLEDSKWLIMKVYSPKMWSEETVEKYGKINLNLLQVVADIVVGEVKMQVGTSPETEHSDEGKHISPDVIAYGALNDTSQILGIDDNGDIEYDLNIWSYSGAFILMEDCGMPVNESKAKDLAPSVKQQVIKNFERLHSEFGVIHNDIRLPNVVFDEDGWPTIIDFQRSYFSDSTLRKDSELGEVKRLFDIDT